MHDDVNTLKNCQAFRILDLRFSSVTDASMAHLPAESVTSRAATTAIRGTCRASAPIPQEVMAAVVSLCYHGRRSRECHVERYLAADCLAMMGMREVVRM
jgi:hypothetical protein